MVRRLVAALISLTLAGVAHASAPNIVVIVTDDQRFDAMGCAGHGIVKTPNIDGLAQRGVRFRNAFATTSICAASRASILTGLYERTHKFTFGTPPLASGISERSFSALLRRAGYQTGLIGKFGVNVGKGQTAAMFDRFEPIGWPFFKKDTAGNLRHIDEIATDRAIDFLKSRDPKRPFCLALCFNGPHADDGKIENLYPWPKSVDGMYDDIPIAPPTLADEKYFRELPEFLQKSLGRVRWRWQFDAPAKYEKNVRAYFRMISGIDREIGRLVAELRRLNLDENTVIVFLSDNGYFLGERGLSGKWIHFEESLRVPLIVVDPRLPKERRGTNVDAVALNVDLAPTVLDWAGLPAEESYQGRSLTPMLRGDVVADWRTEFFCEHLLANRDIPMWEGVRGERYVYARYFGETPPYEFLHDLAMDPRQIRNLVGEARYAETLAGLRRRCDELRDGVGGPYSPERFPTLKKNKK